MDKSSPRQKVSGSYPGRGSSKGENSSSRKRNTNPNDDDDDEKTYDWPEGGQLPVGNGLDNTNVLCSFKLTVT